jgi:signal transduction histidine kinase
MLEGMATTAHALLRDGVREQTAADTPAASGTPRARPTRGERVVDGVLIVLALLAWFYLGFATTSSYPAIPDWFWPLDRSLGLVACAALWWTRRYPVGSAVVAFVPGAFALSAGLVVVFVIYRLGVYAAPRVSVAMTAVYLAAALPYHALFPQPGMSWLSWTVSITLLHALSLSLGLLVRSRRLVVEGLRAEAVRQRERAEAHLADARRGERERIAREMHDVLAHRVSLVSVHAGALEFRTSGGGPPPTPEEIRDAAAVIRHNAHLAVEELRQVLTVLQDSTPSDIPEEADAARVATLVRPQPRLPDLERLLDDARAAGQRVQARLDLGPLADLPDGVQRTVVRVVQEGLTNARKHAPGADVRVEVVPDGDGLRATVRNALPLGVTKGEIPGTGAGLAGVAERVRLEGGVVEHGVRDGEFRLAVRLPRRRS